MSRTGSSKYRVDCVTARCYKYKKNPSLTLRLKKPLLQKKKFFFAMIYYVLVLLFLSGVSEIVAQELGSGDDRPANDSRSPQFIYMTRLHNKIVETQTQITAVGEHSSNEGTLLATSFEAEDATGKLCYMVANDILNDGK